MNTEFERARELGHEHGLPLLMLSRRVLRDNLRRLQEQLPGVELFYAVKSNPSPLVLETLRDAGCRFDVASSHELESLQALGADADEALYTNPVKAYGEVARAVASGANVFFYDNVDELDKIAAEAPGAKLVLRLAVVNPDCVVDLGAKFGCDPQEAEALLDGGVERGLRPFGLAFHVGSQSAIPQPFVDMIHVCRQLFNQMAVKGRPLEMLDIGGGFPVPYKSHAMSLESFTRPIRDALNSYFPDTRIVAEPGRILSATAVKLAARVIGRSVRQGMPWYYLEDGVYGTFSGAVFDKASYVFTSERSGSVGPCVLAGPTCDSFDVISREERLPALEPGDVVIAENMGAYTSASATHFNGIPMTKIVAVD